ncbi:MAG: DUF2299 family protein [Candidatus Helarchaeota archaeon]|nr:DUF2299 family protein [Candidatus Helarchaeota archaeon]
MDRKQVEKKIKDWCMDEGIFKIKRPSDPKTDFIIDLTYPFNHPRPMSFVVLVPKERDLLKIICGTKISPPHLQCLKKPEIRQRFLQTFTKNMLFIQVIHSIKHEKNVPVFWELSDQIYFDGLNKNEFFKAIRKVYFAAISAILLLNELCTPGEIAKTTPEMDHIPFYG